MAHRLIVLVAVVTLWCPAPAFAQEPVTLRAIVAAVSEGRVRAGFADAHPSLDQELGEHLQTLSRSGMLDYTAEELAAAVETPRLSALARVRSGLVTPQVAVALSEIKGLRNNELREALEAATSVEEARKILQPVTAFQAAQLDRSLANSAEILRKYERKFGPASARLNGAEVVLNYALQGVAGFGPNADGEPGPFEAIASYSPTYMTYAAGQARMVSASEFGLRRYIFNERWGTGGLNGLMRPAFITLGLAVASEEDGALRWPWKGESRLGAFFSWGELKVAYVHGDDQRLLVSRQFQLVPWVF